MALLQDIGANERSLWTTLQTYWANGNYAAVLSLLNNSSQLISKFINASWFNNLTGLIYELETNPVDTSFKADKIQVAETPPTLSRGQIYFQID